MEELYSQLLEHKQIDPPIYKIDGMVVNTRFYVSGGWTEETTFYFEVSLCDGALYLDYGTTYEDFCRMIEGLKDMKFDVLSGEFINPNKLVPRNKYVVKQMPMFHHPNIEMIYSECCVCLEFTVSKTYCKHSLCLRCTDKIKNNSCPMCRGTIFNHVD